MELLVRFGATLVALLVCGIPTWTYLLVRQAFDPQGFWQELVLVGVGLYVLWGTQVFLGLVFLVALFFIWTAEFF